MKLKKFLRNKKGFNDIVIFVGYVGFILISSFLITLANAGLNAGVDEFDYDERLDQTREDVDSINQVNAFSVLLNAFKLALWDIGDTLNLPAYLDLFYTMFTITIVVVIARNIWIGGGN